jgi:hypothetical protein
MDDYALRKNRAECAADVHAQVYAGLGAATTIVGYFVQNGPHVAEVAPAHPRRDGRSRILSPL